MTWGAETTAASKPPIERLRWARCPECKAIVLEQDIEGHDTWHAEQEQQITDLEQRITDAAGVELIEWPAELDA